MQDGDREEASKKDDVRQKLEKKLLDLTLELVETEDKERRLMLQENIGAIENAFKRLKPEVQPSAPRGLPTTEEDGAFHVFCQALSREIDSAAETEFDFKMSWWNSTANGSAQKLWVRECYKSLFDACVESRRNGITKFLLEGTPGTGKSGFGLYCVIRFVRQGALVWYRYKKHAPMLFVGSEDAKKLFEAHVPEVKVTPGVVYPMDEMYTRKLEEIPGLVRIFDPEAGCTVSTEGNLFDIIVSSPDTVKLGEVRKLQTSAIRYVPLWTLDELRHIQAYHTYGADPLFYLESQLRTFGGTPRVVFDPEGSTKLHDAIRKATTDDLKGFFDKSQKGSLLPLLIHMKPSQDYKEFEYKIATDEIGQKLVQNFTRSLQTDLEWWLSSCRNDPEMAATRGKLLEHQWHRRIQQGGRFRTTSLGSYQTPRVGQPMTLDFPTLNLNNFNRLSDLTTMQPNVYYRPKFTNFKTFDSFAVLPKQVFTGNAADSTVLVVVGYQMTVAELHPLKKSGIEELEEKVRALFPQVAEFYIVFVSERYTGIQVAQEVKFENGNALKPSSKLKEVKYRQYVCTQED